MAYLGAGADTIGLKDELFPDLEPGERIVWAARPNPRAFAVASIAIFIFGLFWTGFSVFWTVMASGLAWFSDDHVPRAFSLMGLFGLPFIAIGIGMLSSPIWMRSAAKRSVYAITDRRAIVRTGKAFGGVQVDSFYPDRLTSMSRRERRDGSGDLVFEQFTTRQGSGTTTVRRGFIGVDDVRNVEALIQKTLLANRPTRAV